jgi:transcription initiation factor TFIIH subunit 2
MGFPKRVFEKNATFGFDGKSTRVASTFYVCPRCQTKTTDIPTQCCCCTLQLNSSSHIARSHHHIFPVPNFEEVSETHTHTEGGDTTAAAAAAAAASSQGVPCTGCSESLAGIQNQCPHCRSVFCVECDLFIHDNLHNCPGCADDQ